MKVNQVSVSVRYSKGLSPGEHKTIELSAEASIDPEETWTLVQQGLYTMLTAQLRTLWSQNQNGSQKPIEGTWEELESYPSTVEGPARQPAPPPHWCPEHQTEFKRYEKDGKAWYSHKAGDSWCREQQVMKEVV
jgi:hypothetical protein